MCGIGRVSGDRALGVVGGALGMLQTVALSTWSVWGAGCAIGIWWMGAVCVMGGQYV